jgi:amino acid adenylation domain-containing protein
MSTLLNEIASLSPKRRSLFEMRLHRLQRVVAPPPRVLPRPPELAEIPLSFAQERLWLLDRLAPGNPAYVVQLALRVEGPLDLAALAGALHELTRRHEILRTTYPEVDGRPVQRIGDPQPVPMLLVDLGAGRRAEVDRLATRDGVRPFVLARGPVLRAVLLRLDGAEHVLSLTMHHIVNDGWSTAILYRELVTLYRAGAAAAPSPLPELEVQYADYAIWQRRQLQGERLAAALAYWRRQLDGAPPLLELPADRPRPLRPTSRGRARQVRLPAALGQALEQLSAAHGATLYMVLLTAWRTLLARYSGQDDICIGMPIAERDCLEVEALIGFFVNNLVIRTRLAGGLGFRQALAAVREVVLDALAHRALPFEQLVSELRPERSAPHSPLFQALLVLHNAPRPEAQNGSLRLFPLQIPSATTKYDLSLALDPPVAGRLGGILEYSVDLFDGATVERMVQHFAGLLAALAAHPDRPLQELPLWTAAERHQALCEWNDTQVTGHRGWLLCQLVERQVAATPDAVAVIAERSALTYRQLGRQARRLARRLRRAGTRPEQVVGVCLERSPAMVVALLAVLEAGAAYLPLDPDLPRQRLDAMLEDAGVRLVVTDGASRGSLASAAVARLELGDDEPAAGGELAAGPGEVPDPDALAYVIFTSGSTGRPKAAMNTHRAICNRLLWMQARYRLTPRDRVLQKTPLSFDVSVWELFWPLLAGAGLVLARPGGHREPAYLAAVIARQAVTVVHFVPSMLQSFLPEPGAGRCDSLRLVICSGEALSGELLAQFFARFPCELHNLYGPTEAAVDVTAERCAAELPAAAPPLGRPIWNLRLYVRDRDGQPLPIGVPGELHLAGAGLARGYLARPDLTAERFIPDPFSGEPGTRLYRTGDRARCLPDGRIEFLGRLDAQLKIRGIRIEPGEIEAALRGHAAILDAVVVADPRPESGRLVAYVVPAPPAAPTEDALRSHLRAVLPEPMVPAFFVFLPELPRTASGKLDRRALPAVEVGPAGQAVAPRTLEQELLLAIWSEVLGAPGIGIGDSFVELGGHSLTAIRALSRVRDTLGVELPLRSLFDAPTVERFGEVVAQARRGAVPDQPPPLEPGPRPAAIPLSFAQQRLWILDRLEPGNSAYNLGEAFRIAGEPAIEVLALTVSEMVRRHESLRTTFAVADGEPVQVVAPPWRVPLPLIDLSALPAGVADGLARRLLAGQQRRSFDLARGPLLRALLLRLARRDHVAFLVAHHGVADGWSLALLSQEMGSLYDAFLARRPSPLPELSVQYADFALWQRAWLTGAVLERETDHWRRQLAGAPPLLSLPADRPRPAVQRFRGATVAHALPPALAEELQRFARQREVTLFILMLAAFATLLQRCSGQDDVSIGVPTAGRNRRELEGLVGFLVNTLVLRTDLGGDPAFAALLRRVREIALDAHAHQDLPFEKLVEELRPERSLGHTPLFQVMLLFQTPRARAPRLAGLELQPFRFDDGMSKLDLTLVVDAPAAAGAESARPACGGAFEYNCDLFDRATIERLWSRFETLLHGIVATPGRSLSALPLLTAAESQAVLREHNDTRTAAAADGVCRRLEAQAALAPEAVAIEAAGESLTYGALNRLANGLARRLRRLGVGPEARVGFCMERHPAMVVGLFGVLKAGGCYVPLDPAQPRPRTLAMLEDSRPVLLLTERRCLSHLPAELPALCLDDELPALAAESAGDLADGPLPEQLAYVIYTSGSTGRPKGVEVAHGALANFLASMLARPGLSRRDRLLAVTPLSFDIAGLEIYLPLIAGARLLLADRATAADGRLLLGRLGDHHAGVMQATGATWRLLLEAGWQGDGALAAWCGGEALPGSLAGELCQRASEVWNLYGPTETTIWSSLHPVTASEAAVQPIGRPIANTSLVLADRHLQAVALGAPGEICIGGDGLARGYHGAPAMTAERFVPDPWADVPGARLYRTGDLARRLPGGEVEYLGRIDQQVKIRGFRIELGEVEAALLRSGDFAAAAAEVRTDRAGEKRLVAYVVPGAAAVPDLEELRRRLAATLPDYMLPSALVALAALPLTANGKLDRRALPPPEWDRDAAAPAVAPRTRLEEVLAAIWAEVLAVERVGVNDNFFALGGHSLLAARLAFAVQQALGVEIQLRTLFEAPTVAALAPIVARLELQRGGEPTRPSLAQVVPNPGDRYLPFPLTDVQQAYWVGRSAAFDLGEVASHNYVELDLPGLDLERFATAFNRLIARHDMLRARVLPDGRQQVLASVPPYRIEVLELADLEAEAAAAQLQALRRRMSHQVLPADRWPLFELAAARLPPSVVRLHFSLDYLIADAWSNGLLRRELGVLYADPEAPLPALELSFRDCVLGELACRESEAYRRAWDYWRGRLADLPPAPELPLARGAAAGPTRFTRHEARLERERWRRLRERAAQAGITASGALLAAFAAVLRTFSKSPRFTINLTLFNRLPLHPQVEQVVGDFTSLTLLAAEDPGAASFEVQARTLQAQLWRDLDARLVNGVQLLRELSRGAAPDRRTLMPVVFTSTLNLDASRPQDAAEDALTSAGEFVYGITQTPQVWLDHQVAEIAGALVFNWDAIDEIFPPGLVDAMFAAYCRLLERLADEPASWLEPPPPFAGEPLAALAPALAEAAAAAECAAAPLAKVTLHGLFERQAARDGQRPAVISDSRQLDYGTLDRLANALAHRLCSRGARPGRLVAVVMEKGWEQVVAVLGVLKAGAAYLPIDPDLPGERWRGLLAQGEVAIAVTQPWVDARLDWPPAIARLCVAGDAGAAQPPAVEPDAAAIAYVIFTSGSTGVPKGVVIDHRGAVNTVLDVNERFAVGQDDRILALSSLSFDLSVYDLFGALAAGGAVVMPAAGRDPASWAEAIGRWRVTIWNSVPALAAMLVEHGAGRALPLASLRLALLSGDWIPVTLPDRLRALAPAARMVSLGGATEASIWSVLYPIDRVDPSWTSIPYGRAMLNQRLYVLDSQLQPRPPWVPGDLYIGGIGLAHGYWRDDERTRASFVDHPRTGERLYRTGDLGRWLPDGDVEFLGREDTQVKIQGHRIELGEIEAALEALPEVRSAVAAAIGPNRFERRLVAYVVPRSPSPGAGAAPEAATGPGPAAPWLEGPGELQATPQDLAELGRQVPPSPSLRRCDRRRTRRDLAAAPLPRAQLAELLSCLSQVDMEPFPLPKYRYPSAGNLYPVQVYLGVRPGRVEEVGAGFYYYHPKRRHLCLLTGGWHLDRTAYAAVNRGVFDHAAGALFLVARLDAIAPVYGDLARDFCLLEAGYMGELLMETAAAAGVGLCPIGDVDYRQVAPLLDLDGSAIMVHSFLAGPLPAAAAGAAPRGPLAAAGPSAPEIAARTAAAAARREPPPSAPVAAPLTALAALELKLSEPGLRRDTTDRPLVEWETPPPAGEELQRYAARRSHREFSPAPASRHQLGCLLEALAQVHAGGAPARYRYPSAGGLYAVRTYLHVKADRVAGLAAGSYEYDPHRHRLAPIAPGATLDRSAHAAVNQAIIDQAAFSIFLVAAGGDVNNPYGNLARDFFLLEAGYMGQLLMTVAPDCGLGLCPIGAVDAASIAALCRLAPEQLVLHSLLGGPLPPSASSLDGSQSPAAARAAFAERVRERLRLRLPGHMVPASVVVLDALPLSANGKVDRRALPEPGQAAPPARAPFVAPSSDRERLIAEIWRDVLQLPRVGIHDNFFELGGNSLHMVRAHARLQAILGPELRMTDLFRHPTVGALAAHLGAATPAGPSFDALREQAGRQRRELERQRQLHRDRSRDE